MITSAEARNETIVHDTGPDRGARFLDVRLFAVVSVLLIFVMVLLCSSLYFQFTNYNLGIARALTIMPTTDHAIVISYARAWDFAVVKTSSLFLAFMLIFTGALYVLKAADAGFALTIESPVAKGALQTSSPGLVMITLGVLLVALTIYSRTYVEYSDRTRPPALEPVEAKPVEVGKPKEAKDVQPTKTPVPQGSQRKAAPGK